MDARSIMRNYVKQHKGALVFIIFISLLSIALMIAVLFIMRDLIDMLVDQRARFDDKKIKLLLLRRYY